MQIIDTHCHYNLEPLYSGQAFCFKIKDGDPVLKMDWQQHWQKAQVAGVKKSIIVGPGLVSSRKAIALANLEENFYASVGIHPERANKIEDVSLAIKELEEIATDKKVVAIGETGLDYFYLKSDDPAEIKQTKEKQKQLFIGQIQLAQKLDLPLILHVRDQGESAYLETLEILNQYWHFQKALIFHCVSGPQSYIEKALKMEKSYFGFDGNITFKKADEIREIFKLVQKTNSKKILLETDAPYLAPEPHRGKICEPAMILQTATYLEKEFNINLEEVYQNSLDAFGIN